MKKILFFTGSMSKSGGIERVTANLANMWAEDGYCVEIVVLDRDTSSFFKLATGIVINTINLKEYNSKIEMIPWFIKMVYYFRCYIKKSKPDVILGIWTSRAACAIISAAFLKIPVIACEHIAFYELRRGLQILRKYTYPYANAVVSLTKNDTELYKKMNKNSFTIVNAVEPIYKIKHLSNEKVILAVGRLVPQKGLDILLKSWNLISKSYPNWKLKIVGRVLIGYEDYAKSLYDFVKKNDLEDSVIFQDQTKKILEEYDKAAFFVLSSRFEGLPMVLLEAMSRGLAVISFDCPTGPKDVITDKKNGILVENGNIELLSKAIEKLINDKDYRNYLGENANVEIIRHYSNEFVKKCWDNLLSKVGV